MSVTFAQASKTAVSVLTGLITIIGVALSQNELHGTAQTAATIAIAAAGAAGLTPLTVFKTRNAPSADLEARLVSHEEELNAQNSVLNQLTGSPSVDTMSYFAANGVAGYGNEAILQGSPLAMEEEPDPGDVGVTDPPEEKVKEKPSPHPKRLER